MSVVVICTNDKDQNRAHETLKKVRKAGKWGGDLVWIAIDFIPSEEFVAKWNIKVLHRTAYDFLWLWDLRQKHPFPNSDSRETKKLIQFSKWRVFDSEFKKYKSLLYLDAGMHISHPISQVFSVPHENAFVGPDDRFPFDDPSKNFKRQWDETSMPEHFFKLSEYCKEIDPELMEQKGYFLNCMWLMDTKLIQHDTQQQLLALTKRFPISKTNEMAVMNLYFYKNWKPLPEKMGDLRIFDWTERGGYKNKDYILLKYPHFPQ